MTKILYYHVMPLKDYMKNTYKLIEYLSSYHSGEFEIIDCVTRINSLDMGKHLGDHWNTGHDLIIIGQDNIPTVTMLYQLKICEEKLCVNPCISYPASTALERPVLNQIDKYGKIYEATAHPHTSYYGGTGVSKISKRVQSRIKSDFKFGFPMFDSELKKLGLINWHCHYPTHRHMKQNIKDRHW